MSINKEGARNMEILGLLRVTTSSDPKKDHSMDYMNM